MEQVNNEMLRAIKLETLKITRIENKLVTVKGPNKKLHKYKVTKTGDYALIKENLNNLFAKNLEDLSFKQAA